MMRRFASRAVAPKAPVAVVRRFTQKAEEGAAKAAAGGAANAGAANAAPHAHCTHCNAPFAPHPHPPPFWRGPVFWRGPMFSGACGAPFHGPLCHAAGAPPVFVRPPFFVSFFPSLLLTLLLFSWLAASHRRHQYYLEHGYPVHGPNGWVHHPYGYAHRHVFLVPPRPADDVSAKTEQPPREA